MWQFFFNRFKTYRPLKMAAISIRLKQFCPLTISREDFFAQEPVRKISLKPIHERKSFLLSLSICKTISLAHPISLHSSQKYPNLSSDDTYNRHSYNRCTSSLSDSTFWSWELRMTKLTNIVLLKGEPFARSSGAIEYSYEAVFRCVNWQSFVYLKTVNRFVNSCGLRFGSLQSE